MPHSIPITEMPDTKRRLLDAAIQLMLRQGFAATTVDQICEDAKLTKGSFFHYFASKEEIGEGALDYYFAQQNALFAQSAFNRLDDPLERLHGLLDFIGQRAGGHGQVEGCLMGNFTQELALTHPRIRAACEEKFARLGGFVEATVREAKAKYCPRAQFDCRGVATLFISLMQGSMLLAKARQDKSLLAENLAHFRAYVDTLLGKERRR